MKVLIDILSFYSFNYLLSRDNRLFLFACDNAKTLSLFLFLIQRRQMEFFILKTLGFSRLPPHFEHKRVMSGCFLRLFSHPHIRSKNNETVFSHGYSIETVKSVRFFLHKFCDESVHRNKISLALIIPPGMYSMSPSERNRPLGLLNAPDPNV